MNAQKQRKEQYQPPRLVKYGDVAKLTRGSGGAAKDGSTKPSSKTTGAI